MPHWTLGETLCDTILGAINERGKDFNLNSLVSFFNLQMTVVFVILSDILWKTIDHFE